ncbi:YlqD family protein [Aquibacillus kalidii]|uniref:YlqD family protein n=1 Tax=Aquibacillus kalidii TaxID=2762597 RepID=UPI00164493FC|nr:YlqD family protein [Aquibacillus kalidii]
MEIIQKIPVKQILTENSKKQLRDNFYKHKQQLEQECQQLIFEQKKLQNKKGVSKQDIMKRFQPEITKRTDKMKWIEFQIEQLEILPIGSEIVEGEVETLVEVKEGSNWNELFNEKAIIIRDGIVIQIK